MSSSKPMTVGELQLYKVLQRANLLSYYESFISQGGDDVQQLCEAGEEEFLEIMALVGMACKPLHVRRLQKSLQEWVTRPGIFRSSNLSFQYLPAQSIPLSSVGLDVSDLPMPAQTIHSNTGKSKSSESAFSTPRPMNRPGNTNVFKLHNSSTRRNSQSVKKDVDAENEIHDDTQTSIIMDSMVQKHLSDYSRVPAITDDLLTQLHADESLHEIGIAVSSSDNDMLEALVEDFVRKNIDVESDSTTRHEALLHDAAVKLCVGNPRFLLKKSELSTAAKKIACDVESTISRRSSIHLHGSTNQPRTPSQSQTAENKKSALDKISGESHMIDSDGQCNDRLNDHSEDATPERLSPVEDKSNTINQSSKESSNAAVTTLAPFSSDLAELAKAHNLSLGNLQPLPSSSEVPSSQKGRDSDRQEKSKEKESSISAPRAVRLGKRKLSNGSLDFDGSKKLIAAGES